MAGNSHGSRRDNKSAKKRKSDPRKQSLLLPVAMIDEIKAEAIRQERSFSWVVNRACKLAMARLKALSPDEG